MKLLQFLFLAKSAAFRPHSPKEARLVARLCLLMLCFFGNLKEFSWERSSPHMFPSAETNAIIPSHTSHPAFVRDVFRTTQLRSHVAASLFVARGPVRGQNGPVRASRTRRGGGEPLRVPQIEVHV